MKTLPSFLKEPQLLYIGGRWTESSDGRYYDDINPATEEVITTVAKGTRQDVDLAVEAARNSLSHSSWGGYSARQRGKILHRMADLLEKHKEEFAALETIDTGKTINESLHADMQMCIDVLDYYAGAATKLEGSTLPTESKFFTFTLREPVGVIACITPWNFPLTLALWKAAPALAAGNAVILKPSSLTPLTAVRFARIAEEAGLPAGALNVITGEGGVVGEALVDHAGIDKISFTGETETGRKILERSSSTLKRVTLELGGKSPNIIFRDADIETAAMGAFNAIFYNKGEVCSAGSRLFVEKPVHAEVIARISERAARMTMGDPLDKNTRMGPLVSKSQLDKVESYVESGKKEGAMLVTGGARPDKPPKGYFYKPTVFDNVTNSMAIAREEIFGPVLSVIEFSDFNEVLDSANDSFYGLAAGIWTKNISKALKTAKALKAGTVWVNCYNFFDACAPFGGYRQSGLGRELGLKGLEACTELKSVWINVE